MARLVPWLTGALVVVLMTFPWIVHLDHVVGSPLMEADNHVWMLWRATRGAGAWSGFPSEVARPVQDVIHVPWFLVFDPARAYGVALAVDVAVAFAGGWALSREAGAPRGAVVGGVVLATAPVLSGAVVFGLSEAWPIGWYALHVALLLSAVRRSSVGHAVASGGALGLFGLSGWYFAAFALLGAPFVVAWAAPATRRGVGLVLLAGGLALAIVGPALADFLAHGDVAGLAAREAADVVYRPDWRHAPPGGTDLLNLALPTTHRVELSRTAYLGLAALVLAVAGARRAPVAALGAAWFAVLALGPTLTVAGRPLASPLPAGWLVAAFAPLAGLAHWYRAAAPAMVFLAPIAALGAERSGRLAPALAAVVLADALWLCDAPWPRPTYDPRPPPALVAVPGDGPLLILPFDRGDRRWPPGVPRAYQRWQPWLDRPISEAYEARDPLLDEPLVAWADVECAGGRWLPDARYPGPPPPVGPPTDPGASAAALSAMGLEAIAVVLPRAATPNRCVRALSDALGPPDASGEVVTWWRLPGRR